MTNTYARERQLPTGRIQARDLIAGDTILIRREGALERTPETITAISHGSGVVTLSFEWGFALVSPKIPVALA